MCFIYVYFWNHEIDNTMLSVEDIYGETHTDNDRKVSPKDFKASKLDEAKGLVDLAEFLA